MKPRVLVIIGYYLPGFKSGGPIQSVASLVSRLSDEFQFAIVTRDRDAGDTVPYADVATDVWLKRTGAHVLYVPAKRWGAKTLWRLMRQTPHEVLYLNSFFSPSTALLPLVLNLLCYRNRVPVVLAPRGQFSQGALGLKRVKKKAFIAWSRWARIHSRVTWQATTPDEADLIVQTIGCTRARIVVAPNMSSSGQTRPSGVAPRAQVRSPGPLRLIFLSRISPMKNLEFLLRVLALVETPVSLRIHGPVSDPSYWTTCAELMGRLPRHVNVDVGQALTHDRVGDAFAEHDLFVFPTLGENFGHAIAESLAAGTPVLVSNHTPWRTDGTRALEEIELREELWRVAIEAWARRGSSELSGARDAALAYWRRYCLTMGDAEARSRELFHAALATRLPDTPTTL